MSTLRLQPTERRHRGTSYSQQIQRMRTAGFQMPKPQPPCVPYPQLPGLLPQQPVLVHHCLADKTALGKVLQAEELFHEGLRGLVLFLFGTVAGSICCRLSLWAMGGAIGGLVTGTVLSGVVSLFASTSRTN